MPRSALEELTPQAADLLSVVIVQIVRDDKEGAIGNLHNLKKRLEAAINQDFSALKRSA